VRYEEARAAARAANPPLPVGTRVYHGGQIWARTLPGGTGYITGVMGPYHDDTYEYFVTTTENFASRPGPDNPETRPTQWSSRVTLPAYAPEH